MAKGLRSTGAIGVFSALNRLRKRLPYEPMYLIGEYAGAYRLRQRPRIPTETQNARGLDFQPDREPECISNPAAVGS